MAFGRERELQKVYFHLSGGGWLVHTAWEVTAQSGGQVEVVSQPALLSGKEGC